MNSFFSWWQIAKWIYLTQFYNDLWISFLYVFLWLKNYQIETLLILLISVQSIVSSNLRRYVVIAFFRKIFLPKPCLVLNIPKIPEVGFWKRSDIINVNLYVHEVNEQFRIKMEIHSANSIIYQVQIDSESLPELARAKTFQIRDDILGINSQIKVVLIWNHGKSPPS